ncbi:unnamed protein product [Notodromas monacha]|uniref:Uncharacterized protein n=1 Tax=Notodromas monacha TaxID=399045 RepID=A0A7R9GGV0_9CRUS|nr:unnamed protein product [Notodromas monacha]CAG0922233.1 unnamed protein product [Notodromas monacha]
MLTNRAPGAAMNRSGSVRGVPERSGMPHQQLLRPDHISIQQQQQQNRLQQQARKTASDGQLMSSEHLPELAGSPQRGMYTWRDPSPATGYHHHQAASPHQPRLFAGGTINNCGSHPTSPTTGNSDHYAAQRAYQYPPQPQGYWAGSSSTVSGSGSPQVVRHPVGFRVQQQHQYQLHHDGVAASLSPLHALSRLGPVSGPQQPSQSQQQQFSRAMHVSDSLDLSAARVQQHHGNAAAAAALDADSLQAHQSSSAAEGSGKHRSARREGEEPAALYMIMGAVPFTHFSFYGNVEKPEFSACRVSIFSHSPRGEKKRTEDVVGKRDLTIFLLQFVGSPIEARANPQPETIFFVFFAKSAGEIGICALRDCSKWSLPCGVSSAIQEEELRCVAANAIWFVNHRGVMGRKQNSRCVEGEIEWDVTPLEFSMADEALARSGLYFDELNKIRVLEPEAGQQTQALRDNCQEFSDRKEVLKQQKIVDDRGRMPGSISEQRWNGISDGPVLMTCLRRRETESHKRGPCTETPLLEWI